jgi:hypothetical protein
MQPRLYICQRLSGACCRTERQREVLPWPPWAPWAPTAGCKQGWGRVLADGVGPCLGAWLGGSWVNAVGGAVSKAPGGGNHITRSTRFAKAPGRTSSGHALHVCAAARPRASLMSVPLVRSPPVLRARCALDQTRSGLEFGSPGARPRESGASKADSIPPFLRRRSGGGGEGQERPG